MPKMTFIAQHKDLLTNTEKYNITVDSYADSLYEIIENFELFLRGSGFYLDGRLEIVPFDEDPPNFDFTELSKVSKANDSYFSFLEEYDRIGNCSK
jgi:hypothetical protein